MCFGKRWMNRGFKGYSAAQPAMAGLNGTGQFTKAGKAQHGNKKADVQGGDAAQPFHSSKIHF